MAESLHAAIDGLGFGPFQWRLTAVMAMMVTAEAIEFFTISYVMPFAACSWGLTGLQAAYLSTAFFLGLILGNYAWGALADLLGRQRCLVCAGAVAVYFSLLSTFSPAYMWFGFLRGVVGFALSGAVNTVYPLYMELSPSSHRHVLFLLHPVVGSAGCVLLYCLGAALLPAAGWRAVVAVAAVPGLMAVLLAAFLVPRSPRFLLLQGDREAAAQVLALIARLNRRPPPPLPPAASGEVCGAGRIFCPSQLRLTAPLLLLWLCAGLLHYSTMLLGLVLPSVYANRCPPAVFRPPPAADRSCQCAAAQDVLLAPLVGGALGEAVSLIFPGVLANFAGRRAALGVAAALAGLLTPLHALCKSAVGLGALLCAQRAATLGLFLACVQYSTEAFPTAGRAAALGLGSSVNRVGNLLAPFLVNDGVAGASLWTVLGCLSGVAAVAVGMVLLLPFETRGRRLYDTFQESETAERQEKKYGTFDRRQ